MSVTHSELYTETREHAHAALSEKDVYMNLSPANRCVRLASACNKSFDYCETVELKAVGDDTWVAVIWPDTPDARPCADKLMAVDFEGATAIESARLEVINSRPDVPTVCLSEAAGATVSVPYVGLPLVALYYSSVVVRVRAPDASCHVTVRYRVLPKVERRNTAYASHVIKINAAPLNGARVRIHGTGIQRLESSKGCCCW